jgi:ribonuclease VapC
MVIDTSALIAIVLHEPSSEGLLHQVDSSARRVVSAVSLLEAGIVLRARNGPGAVPILHQIIEELGAEVIAFDAVQARLAIVAFGRFGKGMGHRAQLNFGDCAVYALAESRGEPVLAIGDDFSATDLRVTSLRYNR